MRPEYSDEFKAKVVAYAQKHSYRATARKFGIRPSTVALWLKNAGKYEPRRRGCKSAPGEYVARNEQDHQRPIGDVANFERPAEDEAEIDTMLRVLRKVEPAQVDFIRRFFGEIIPASEARTEEYLAELVARGRVALVGKSRHYVVVEKAC